MASEVFKYNNAKVENLYPASTLAGLFLKYNLPEVKKIWMLGCEDMKEEL